MKKIIFRSVTFKMLASVILIILPVNILMIFSSATLTDASRKQIVKESENSLHIYMDELEQEIFDTDRYLIKLKTDEFYLKVTKGQELNQYEYVRAQTQVINNIADYLENTDLVSGIAIVFNDRNLILRRDRSVNLDKHLNEILRVGTKKDVRWEICHIDSEWYILRTVQHQRDTTYVWMRLSSVCSYFQNIEMQQNNLSFLNAKTDTVIAGINENRKDNQIRVESDLYSLSIVRTMQDNDLKVLPQITIILEILSVLAMIAIPLLVLQLRKQVILPVTGLMKAIRKIQQGNLDYRIEMSSTSNEFEQINGMFNDMMDQIQTLKLDVYEEKIEKQNIQLEYISHQIQPHFVLNTLNILYCYNQDEYPLMLKMIKLLMNYFRYIVKVNSYYVSVEQELAHIQNYLELQKIRYPEHFYYYIESDPSIVKCLIPPLCIQNFVENSIKNAISLDYNIDIYVLVEKMQDSKMRIRVADTGKGFSEDILEEIERFKKTHKQQPHLGVGLQNAILRLKILYHELPEIKIYNSVAGGATVDILLPIHMEEQTDVQCNID